MKINPPSCGRERERPTRPLPGSRSGAGYGMPPRWARSPRAWVTVAIQALPFLAVKATPALFRM